MSTWSIGAGVTYVRNTSSQNFSPKHSLSPADFTPLPCTTAVGKYSHQVNSCHIQLWLLMINNTKDSSKSEKEYEGMGRHDGFARVIASSSPLYQHVCCCNY
jgi:hypothetical protein